MGLPRRAARRVHEVPHGTQLRDVWRRIHRHCNDPKHSAWRYWGAVGVRVCEDWSDFAPFYEWGLAAGFRPGLVLTRRPGKGVDSPDNCIWVERKEAWRTNQKPKLLEAWGETKAIADWLRDRRCKVTAVALKNRLARGFSPEEAISRPPFWGMQPSAGDPGVHEHEFPALEPVPQEALPRAALPAGPTLDRAEIVRLARDEGHSGAEIARRLGYTANRVNEVLRAEGLRRAPTRYQAKVPHGPHLHRVWTRLRIANDRQRLKNELGDPVHPCPAWADFWSFYDWAIAAGYRKGQMLLVTGNAREASPETCRWVSPNERYRLAQAAQPTRHRP